MQVSNDYIACFDKYISMLLESLHIWNGYSGQVKVGEDRIESSASDIQRVYSALLGAGT